MMYMLLSSKSDYVFASFASEGARLIIIIVAVRIRTSLFKETSLIFIPLASNHTMLTVHLQGIRTVVIDMVGARNLFTTARTIVALAIHRFKLKAKNVSPNSRQSGKRGTVYTSTAH